MLRAKNDVGKKAILRVNYQDRSIWENFGHILLSVNGDKGVLAVPGNENRPETHFTTLLDNIRVIDTK